MKVQKYPSITTRITEYLNMSESEKNTSIYPSAERWGASFAHSTLLFIGLPLTIILIPIPFSLAPCPVVAYMLARFFRRRNLSWGADQSTQASAIQVLIFLIAGLVVFTNLPRQMELAIGTSGFLLFLYTLWAAFDTSLGYDFRYVLLGKSVSRVTTANLKRQERRKDWSNGSR